MPYWTAWLTALLACLTCGCGEDAASELADVGDDHGAHSPPAVLDPEVVWWPTDLTSSYGTQAVALGIAAHGYNMPTIGKLGELAAGMQIHDSQGAPVPFTTSLFLPDSVGYPPKFPQVTAQFDGPAPQGWFTLSLSEVPEGLRFNTRGATEEPPSYGVLSVRVNTGVAPVLKYGLFCPNFPQGGHRGVFYFSEPVTFDSQVTTAIDVVQADGTASCEVYPQFTYGYELGMTCDNLDVSKPWTVTLDLGDVVGGDGQTVATTFHGDTQLTDTFLVESLPRAGWEYVPCYVWRPGPSQGTISQ